MLLSMKEVERDNLLIEINEKIEKRDGILMMLCKEVASLKCEIRDFKKSK